jgi:A nuclease family of the HNH/ENDO VII superfamily with conserved AHH
MTKHSKTLSGDKYCLTPDSKYRTDCATGYTKGSKKQRQIHHILCVESVDRFHEFYKGTTKPRYIKKCLELAGYNINHANNTIGLPLNYQIKRSYRPLDVPGAPPVVTPPELINHPGHQVDHNTKGGYRDTVADDLKEVVWESLDKAEKAHDEDADKILKLMEGRENWWRKQLVNVYGIRQGGTIPGWKNRQLDAWKKKWYQPFSMARKPRFRHPGAPSSKMTNLFKLLD